MLASALQSVRNFDRRSRYLLTLVALLAMTTGAWADETYTVQFKANGKTVTKENVTLPYTFKCNYSSENGELDGIIKQLYNLSGGCCTRYNSTQSVSGSENVTTGNEGNNQNITISAPFSGVATYTGKYYQADYMSMFNFSIEISIPGYVDPNAAPEVTISTDQQSAEFDMPSYDATLEYQIVRNMASNMTVSIGDGQDGYRIRVKKQGESFVPAEMTLQQMMALYTVHDATEQKDLLFYGDGKVCDISIFAVDDQGQPTGQAIAFTALTPGRYVAIATAPDDSPLYAGQTPQSNIFVLYQGYEVTVPAQEFITYYSAEPVRVDKTEQPFAEIYTISEVGETTATLSGPLDAMKANKPMLVYNNSTETQNILLIPCNEPDVLLSVAPEFKGSIEATEIPASSETTDYYVCTGNAFVWVKSAGTIGANKCWLEISNQPASARRKARSIVYGDGTTGIGASLVNSEERTVKSDVYDLNGQKVQNPTKKGIYIKNGKKVVIK